jgi:SAM-dependent methyltransferase
LGARDKASNLEKMIGAASSGITSVLEVGCGTGAVLSEVKRRGIGTVDTGVDLADPSTHLDPGAVDLNLIPYDGVKLPFPDKSFDLVYASHVLEHVPHERGFLSDLARVSRGLIYIEVPCELTVRATQEALQPGLDIGHINPYTPASFALTLATSEAQPVALELFDHSYDVHAFNSSPIKAKVVMALRRSLLKAAPAIAPHVFVYHCGAVCQPTPSHQPNAL